MTRTVKGILIDPFACTVTEVEHDAESIDDIYRLLSHETMSVDCFTCAYSTVFAPGDAVFVDDEGLFKNSERFFTCLGNPQALAGKGLVLGSDKDGNTISAKTSLAVIKPRVFFWQEKHWIHDGVMLLAALEATVTPWVHKEVDA